MCDIPMETYSLAENNDINSVVKFTVKKESTSTFSTKGRKTKTTSSTMVDLFTICSVNTVYSSQQYRVANFRLVPDEYEFILSKSALTNGTIKSYHEGMGHEFKKITEDILGSCINGFGISTIGTRSFNMGIEPIFVFSYLLTHIVPSRPDLIRLYKYTGTEPLEKDQIIRDTRVDQILTDKSLHYAIILFYTDNHISTLVYDTLKKKDKLLMLFDTMGKYGNSSALLSNVMSIQDKRIQGSSGCGLLTLAFALELYKERNIDSAIKKVENVQKVINELPVNEKGLDNLKKKLFEAFSLQVTNVLTKTKVGKHGDDDFYDINQENNVLQPSSDSQFEAFKSIDTTYDNTPSPTKSFLEREIEKKQKQEQEQSIDI